MRELKIANYEIGAKDPETNKRISAPYEVRESIVEILFHPELRLNATDLLKTNELAKKILGCKKDYVLLEEEEYQRLLDACNKIQGFGRNEVELVQRILDAKEVEVAKSAPAKA